MPTIKKSPETRFFHPTVAAAKATYSPENLLAAIAKDLKLKNDAQIAKALDLYAPLISKIRNRHITVTPYVLLRVVEATGWTVAEARQKLGA